MAVNNNQHHHQIAAASSSSYQHFQPWLVGSNANEAHSAPGGLSIKREKMDPEVIQVPPNKTAMDMFLQTSSSDMRNPNAHALNSDPQSRMNMGAHHPFQPTPPFNNLNYPPVQKMMANYRDSNPELDLKLQQCIDEGNCVGDFAKKQIVQILESISLLKPPERVLLYLRMPGANCETDPLRQPQNPLGARSEINHTINWVRSHLEPDPKVSIPKKDVYDDYIAYCARNNIKPLSTADFGKVMKQVFPTVRPRRLGTRGHSRYCYAAMRKATKLDPPMLPDLTSPRGSSSSGPGEGMFYKGPLGVASSVRDSDAEDIDRSSWPVIQKWAEGILNVKLESAKDLADHIAQFNVDGDARQEKEGKGGGASGPVKENKKIKDKRKEPPQTKGNSPKKRRKKRRKNSSSGSGDGGDVSGGESEARFRLAAVQVKKEVNSENDEDQIIDLKIQGRNSRSEEIQKMPVKLLLNDVPLDASASSVEETENLQIENVYCKKVRQAQQAKGLWFQQQQQQQQPQSGHSSVIVTPHTFSQPEIPSPSMLSQMNTIRQQQAGASGDRDSAMPKNLNKRDGGGDDALPSDFILPRERVISLCTLDKDALDDYLPLAGDNSQEAEIMQYFDENSSNGQSTGGTENDSPKVDETATGSGATGAVLCASSQMEGNSSSSSSIVENYSMFSGGRSMASKQISPSGGGGGQEGMKGGGVPEQINQLRQFLHQNFQQPAQGARIIQSTSGSSVPYPGSAAASLTMLSQRHNSVNYGPTTVGMDLTQDPGAVAGRPVSLKRRLIPDTGEASDGGAQRRFVPIASPQNLAPAVVVDYTKSVNRMEQFQNRYDDFLSPKMAAMKKQQQQLQQQQLGMHIHKPSVSHESSPVSLIHSGNMNGTAEMSPQNGIFSSSDERKTAFSKPTGGSKYSQQSPGAEMKALNMSTFAESRSASVPLNYRQSPVQVCSSNDGASWSSSYQNNNNAPSSACSSVAQTPIPPEYNDFTEMMNIWDNEMVPGQGEDGTVAERSGQQEDKLFKDSNNNNDNNNDADNNSNDNFMDEIGRGFCANSIISRSVPSTPLPTASAYYPKCNNNNGPSSSVFASYGQQRRYCDASKSVPTTPISSVSSQFRYSPVGDGRSRDFLINGNIHLDKDSGAGTSDAFGFGTAQIMANETSSRGLATGLGGSISGRRIAKIEGDRKEASSEQALSIEKDMSPLEEEISGYDPMMETDLMNQF